MPLQDPLPVRAAAVRRRRAPDARHRPRPLRGLSLPAQFEPGGGVDDIGVGPVPTSAPGDQRGRSSVMDGPGTRQLGSCPATTGTAASGSRTASTGAPSTAGARDTTGQDERAFTALDRSLEQGVAHARTGGHHSRPAARQQPAIGLSLRREQVPREPGPPPLLRPPTPCPRSPRPPQELRRSLPLPEPPRESIRCRHPQAQPTEDRPRPLRAGCRARPRTRPTRLGLRSRV